MNKINYNDTLNDRQKEIFNFINSGKKDFLEEILEEHTFLKDYKYIDTEIEFSLLKPRGIMRYINKYDKKLRTGGLLLKVYEKDGDWYGLVKQYNRNYKVSFKNNFIFYLGILSDRLKEWADIFIQNVDENYDVV